MTFQCMGVVYLLLITIHFSDRERVQIRKDQELELEQCLRIDRKVNNAKILMKSIVLLTIIVSILLF